MEEEQQTSLPDHSDHGGGEEVRGDGEEVRGDGDGDDGRDVCHELCLL